MSEPNEERIVYFSGITPKGYAFLAEMREKRMNEAEEYLSRYVDPETIPEPARSFVLQAMMKLKEESETEGRHQSVQALRVYYLKDPKNRGHYRRVLRESYGHALCPLCDKEPVYFETDFSSGVVPEFEETCEDHVSFLIKPQEYSNKRIYGDTYE